MYQLTGMARLWHRCGRRISTLCVLVVLLIVLLTMTDMDEILPQNMLEKVRNFDHTCVTMVTQCSHHSPPHGGSS